MELWKVGVGNWCSFYGCSKSYADFCGWQCSGLWGGKFFCVYQMNLKKVVIFIRLQELHRFTLILPTFRHVLCLFGACQIHWLVGTTLKSQKRCFIPFCSECPPCTFQSEIRQLLDVEPLCGRQADSFLSNIHAEKIQPVASHWCMMQLHERYLLPVLCGGEAR